MEWLWHTDISPTWKSNRWSMHRSRVYDRASALSQKRGSEWRVFHLAGRRCFLCLGSVHWPFIGHSQGCDQHINAWLSTEGTVRGLPGLTQHAFNTVINRCGVEGVPLDTKSCKETTRESSWVGPPWTRWPRFLSAFTKARKSLWALISALYPHNHSLLTSDLISPQCMMSAGLPGPTKRS